MGKDGGSGRCHLTDEEMQSRLRERGYVVPLMVIRLWPRNHQSGTKHNRNWVEKWLLHDELVRYHNNGRKPKFPQFLAPFDVNIARRFNRIAEEARQTPRLAR